MRTHIPVTIHMLSLIGKKAVNGASPTHRAPCGSIGARQTQSHPGYDRLTPSARKEQYSSSHQISVRHGACSFLAKVSIILLSILLNVGNFVHIFHLF